MGRWCRDMLTFTTAEQSANVFAGSRLDAGKKGAGLELDSYGLSVRNVSGDYWQNVLGTVGMEVRAGSGEVGYFEAKATSLDSGGYCCMMIGLGTQSIKFSDADLDTENAFGWSGYSGCFYSGLIGVVKDDHVTAARKFTVNDVVGVLLDCRSSEPFAALFINKRQVHRVALGPETFGKVFYPVLALGDEMTAEWIPVDDIK